MKLSISKQGSHLHWSGTLDIYAAGEARESLLAYLAEEAQPVLNLAEVDGCDAAGAQLLCAAVKTAALAGHPLTFAAVSPAVLEGLTGLGLALPSADATLLSRP